MKRARSRSRWILLTRTHSTLRTGAPTHRLAMPLARQNALKTSDSLPSFPSNRPNKSKLSIKVLVAQGIHVAGSSIRGELEISVKDRALGLGEVGIELTGVEGENSRNLRTKKGNVRIDRDPVAQPKETETPAVLQMGQRKPVEAIEQVDTDHSTIRFPQLDACLRAAFGHECWSKGLARTDAVTVPYLDHGIEARGSPGDCNLSSCRSANG